MTCIDEFEVFCCANKARVDRKRQRLSFVLCSNRERAGMRCQHAVSEICLG